MISTDPAGTRPRVRRCPLLPRAGAGRGMRTLLLGTIAAFALAASLGDPKTSLDIVIEPAWAGGVFRKEHLEPGVGWHELELDPKRTENLVDLLRETVLHPQVKNPVLRLRTPDAREHQEAFDAELRAALLDGKEAGQALQRAAERWRQLDARKDPRTRLREYRLSLSL